MWSPERYLQQHKRANSAGLIPIGMSKLVKLLWIMLLKALIEVKLGVELIVFGFRYGKLNHSIYWITWTFVSFALINEIISFTFCRLNLPTDDSIKKYSFAKLATCDNWALQDNSEVNGGIVFSLNTSVDICEFLTIHLTNSRKICTVAQNSWYDFSKNPYEIDIWHLQYERNLLIRRCRIAFRQSRWYSV